MRNSVTGAAKAVAKRALRIAGLRRAHLAAARMTLERNVLAAASRAKPRNGGRILCYHSVGQPQMGVNDVSPHRFRQHIEIALAKGYRFVASQKLAQGGGGPKDLAITFDDGLVSVKRNAAPILKDYGIPWSVFVVSDWADHRWDWARQAVLDWRALEGLASDGVELGSHSATHADFGRISRAQMEEEIFGSREIFSQRLGFAPASFAIPFGQSTNWTPLAQGLAEEAGYSAIYAQAEETRPNGTVARTFVTKFDHERIFSALLDGAFDRWEEWY